MQHDISIVVPTHNSQRTIPGLLKSIDRYVPKNIPLIIVDDASNDNTLELVTNHPTNRMTQIIPLMERMGPANARNTGAENTNSDFILFLDSDTEVTNSFIEEIVKPFEREDVICVQGVYENANKKNIISQYEDRQIKMRQKPGFVKNLSSYAMCIKKEAFIKAGGFDTSFPRACGEDTKLGYELTKKGRIFLNNRAVVKHHHNTSITAYLKKQYQRSKWRIYLYIHFPKMAKGDDYSSKRIVVQPFLAFGALFFGASSYFVSSFYWLALISWDSLVLIQLYEVVKTKGVKLRIVTYFLNLVRAFVWMAGMIAGILTIRRG